MSRASVASGHLEARAAFEGAREQGRQIAGLIVALRRREEQLDRPLGRPALGLERVAEPHAADDEVGIGGTATVDLPVDILPNPIAVTQSLYDVLEKDGHRPVRAIQKISAINLPPAEAELLGVAEGAAGLRIERVSYLPSGRVAEFTKSIYRGDAYDFVAELRLQKG